jgi:hypothetical protein
LEMKGFCEIFLSCLCCLSFLFFISSSLHFFFVWVSCLHADLLVNHPRMLPYPLHLWTCTTLCVYHNSTSFPGMKYLRNKVLRLLNMCFPSMDLSYLHSAFAVVSKLPVPMNKLSHWNCYLYTYYMLIKSLP